MAERGAGLFRSEAVQAHARRLEGEVVLGQPPGARLLAPLFGALTLGVGIFLGTASYSRTERVAGYVAPEVGVSAILPQRAGVVSEVRVRVGDPVAAGDLLLSVASESTLSDGAGLESSLREQLLRQRTELATARDAEEAGFAQQQHERRERVAALAQQLEQLAALRAVAAERWSITEDRRERFARLLGKGVVSRDQYGEKRDLALGLQKELSELEMKRLDVAHERERLLAQIASAPREQEEKRADLRLRLSELESRLREVEGRSSFSIKSPVAGRVAALQVSTGSAVTPSVPVAVIMPEGVSFQANLLVPTRASGMIERGQPVGIKYAAFPFEKFGIQRARVADIEAAILSPAELSGPVQVHEPVYRVIAELDAQQVQAFGRPYPLQAGMLLEAEIVLEQRSLLEWILEPLYSLRGAPRRAS